MAGYQVTLQRGGRSTRSTCWQVAIAAPGRHRISDGAVVTAWDGSLDNVRRSRNGSAPSDINGCAPSTEVGVRNLIRRITGEVQTRWRGIKGLKETEYRGGLTGRARELGGRRRSRARVALSLIYVFESAAVHRGSIGHESVSLR